MGVLSLFLAQYGSEGILREIYQMSGNSWKIHVPETKFQDYLYTQDLTEMVSTDPKSAQWIHACSFKDHQPHARNVEDFSRAIPCQVSIDHALQKSPHESQLDMERIRPIILEQCFETGSPFITRYPTTKQA